jgi:hypothetical protein
MELQAEIGGARGKAGERRSEPNGLVSGTAGLSGRAGGVTGAFISGNEPKWLLR